MKVLVFGATGTQGGSIAKLLLSHGHQVIGITRNPNSTKSQEMIELGAEMRSGNFHHSEDLIKLMKEVDTVFAMTTPFEEGIEKETDQGIAMVDAALKAGVDHFVYNSVADADKNTGIPHFDSKYLVEQHLSKTNIPYTIITPVYFMENLISPWTMEQIKEGKIVMAMPSNRILQQIAVQDIAKFVVAVINRKDDFIGKRINIASDELTGEEMANILNNVSGNNWKFEGFDPKYMMDQSRDLGLMYKWFNEVGYTANFDQLRSYFPEVELTKFKDFASKQDYSFMD